MQLVSGIAKRAKMLTRVTATESPSDNDKFTMRLFLVSLNFKGPEYAFARKFLLRNLSGNSGWRTEEAKARHDAHKIRTEIEAPEVTINQASIEGGETVFEQVQEEIARRQSQIKMATHTFKGQFSGLLTCANCGKHFRRRIANASSKYAKPAWLCSTFATRGKRFCNNKQIPEAILISKTKEVLELCSLDGVNLRDYISEIICHKEQNITFVLTNGDEITVAWSNSSRRNSWTEEMKQAARQKTLERSGL